MRRTMPSECCQLFIRKSRAGGLVHVCNLCLCVCVSVSHRACGTGPARMAPRLSVWSFGHVLLRTDVPISFQDDWTGCFFCDLCETPPYPISSVVLTGIRAISYIFVKIVLVVCLFGESDDLQDNSHINSHITASRSRLRSRTT